MPMKGPLSTEAISSPGNSADPRAREFCTKNMAGKGIISRVSLCGKECRHPIPSRNYHEFKHWHGEMRKIKFRNRTSITP